MTCVSGLIIKQHYSLSGWYRGSRLAPLYFPHQPDPREDHSSRLLFPQYAELPLLVTSAGGLTPATAYKLLHCVCGNGNLALLPRSET